MNWIGVDIPTGRGNFGCCSAHCKPLGVSAAAYAAKWIIQSSITARHTMRPCLQILWPLVIVIIIIIIITVAAAATVAAVASRQ